MISLAALEQRLIDVLLVEQESGESPGLYPVLAKTRDGRIEIESVSELGEDLLALASAAVGEEKRVKWQAVAR